MRRTDGEMVPGFAPTEIRNGVTSLDIKGVEAIRLSSEAEYYINGDNSVKANMPAGVTVIDPAALTQLDFSTPQTVEVMKAG